MGMTIEELHAYVVSNITKIDGEIEYLKGKRDAYNDIRLELYPLLSETEQEEKNGNDD